MKFITFEGCDFCGKSTQANLLSDFFKSQKKDTFLTREPGGSNFAEKIRNLLLSSNEITNPLVEYLLLAAARKDHVENVIMKKLEQNYYVISDRFYDSSICYQGHHKKLDFKILEEIKALTIGEFQPDITFLIDTSIDEIKRRIDTKRVEHNIYDKKGIQFHKSIKSGYLEIAKNNPERVIVLSGDEEVEEIQRKIIQIVQDRIL
jgi:dTMP kinase